MYGEMAYHVIKKKRNTDDSSWQDIYIQRGRDAEHPYAIGGRYSFRRLLRRHLFERNAQGGTLKPALDTSDCTSQRDTATQPYACIQKYSLSPDLTSKKRPSQQS